MRGNQPRRVPREMAKLHSYYTLCPLIDQQNLLGVESDSEPGCAIVTLGRNIVIRYKLQDLKQLSSWSSKDRLTTQVIYDASTRKYAAIFNQKKIRLWSEEESDLNNVKSYKFQGLLHTILTCEACPPVLVRKNGATASLQQALDSRKTWSDQGILRSEEKIFYCKLIHTNGRISVCFLTKMKETHYCTVVRLNENSYATETENIRRIELKRRSEELVGYVITTSKNGAYLLTLWSHGRLYCHSLMDISADTGSSTLIGVIANIDTKYPVAMTSLNETTVAVYGADSSEEGAILMIYNVQFKLVQAVQKLKLYTKDAKLWKIEDKLLLAANRHLAIAPYHLAAQKISALLGSSKRIRGKDEDQEEDDVVVIQESTVARWDCIQENKNDKHVNENDQSIPLKRSIDDPPKHVQKQIVAYMSEGYSDAVIHEILIPQLIESKDVSSMIWCIDTLKDLPEKLLIDLLRFSLRNSDEIFQVSKDHEEKTCLEGVSHSRNDFLDKLFSVPYSDVSLSSYLKMGLKFDEVLRLLSYLIEKLGDHEEENSGNDRSQPTEKQVYEWTCLLLDSHYQHYILSRDSEVSTLLKKLNILLEDHIQLLRDLENLRPMLSRIINGKSLKLSPKDRNKFYAIEEIKLY